MIEIPSAHTEMSFGKEFDWKRIERKAKTERDLAILRRREKELSQPGVQLYGILDSPRLDKLKKLRAIISEKESLLKTLTEK